MPVTCTSEGRCLTASIYGEIDHHSAKDVMKELDRQIDRIIPLRLVMDCSGITFMDSSGIAILLRAYHRMKSLCGETTIIGVPPQPAKVLKAAGLHRLMGVQAGT